MPFVYGYRRVSHIDSAISGLSPEAQTMAIEARWQYELRKLEIERQLTPESPKIKYTWGTVGYEGTRKQGKETKDGFFTDLAVSAFKKPIMNRAAGFRLDRVLQRGDIVLFAHLDRAFRSVKDFCIMTEKWHKRGIRIIFCNPDVDLTTPYGEAFAANAAVWAQLDSRLKSNRNREIIAFLKKSGRVYVGTIALGMMRSPANRKRLIPDNEMRRLARRVFQLKTEQRMSFMKISDLIEEEQANLEGRTAKARRDNWDPTKVRRITRRVVQKLFHYWREGKIEPPTDEPLDPEWAARKQAHLAATTLDD